MLSEMVGVQMWLPVSFGLESGQEHGTKWLKAASIGYY